MQKISSSTSTATPGGEFTEGSAAGGIPATLITSEWLNSVQRELLAVLTAAGMPLDPDDDAQLAGAISKLNTWEKLSKKPLRFPTGNYGRWKWQASLSGEVAAGSFALNNVSPALATELRISEASVDATSYVGALSLLQAGDTASIVNEDDSLSYRFRVTGAGVDQGSYRVVPVAYVGGSESLPAANAVASVLFTQAGASDSSVPVGTVMWWPDRRSIPEGFGPGDGQALQRSLYPDLTKMVTGNKLPLATEAAWQSTPAERGKYTLGDGAATIRLPDYNGKSQGSLGALFQRGDGALSAAISGAIQLDALQNITGESSTFPAGNTAPTSSGGAFKTNGKGGVPTGLAGGGAWGSANIDFDASRVARTSTETRPLSVTGCWIIKLFGTVSNEGAADAAALATVYAALVGRVAALEARPRGLGDGQAWKNVTANRPFGTLFTNTSGRTIKVRVRTFHTNRAGSVLEVDGEIVDWEGAHIGGEANVNLSTSLSAEVPHLSTVRVGPLQGYPNPIISAWLEMSA